MYRSFHALKQETLFTSTLVNVLFISYTHFLKLAKMSITRAIPILLCGRTPMIANAVKAGLLPEYEGTSTHIFQANAKLIRSTVAHVILTPEQGSTEIPLLLSGKFTPDAASENIGSKNYSTLPSAVVLGGGYDDAAVKVLREAVGQKEGARDVPWLRPDRSVATPPLGPEYGKAMVQRTKTCLDKLKKDGKIVGSGEVLF
jgi:hypothetical protein